jgi:hypothetical protein
MSALLSLLRSGGGSSTGIERFLEHLEERCLLSAGSAHHPKLIPIDYYAGAGTSVNAFSPNTALTVTSAAPNALPAPAAPLSLAALAPSTSILPAAPGGVSNVDVIVNNPVSAAITLPGPTSSLFADQAIGSIFSTSSATVAPQYQLSSGFMSILSAGQLPVGGLVSVFAGD